MKIRQIPTRAIKSSKGGMGILPVLQRWDGHLARPPKVGWASCPSSKGGLFGMSESRNVDKKIHQNARLKVFRSALNLVKLKASSIICFTIKIKTNCWFISEGFHMMNRIRHQAQNVTRCKQNIAHCLNFIGKLRNWRSPPQSIFLLSTQ